MGKAQAPILDCRVVGACLLEPTMSRQDVLELALRRPFVPFRLFMRDGTVHEIQHPPILGKDGNSVLIAVVEANVRQVCGRTLFVDLESVLCYEPLDGKT